MGVETVITKKTEETKNKDYFDSLVENDGKITRFTKTYSVETLIKKCLEMETVLKMHKK